MPEDAEMCRPHLGKTVVPMTAEMGSDSVVSVATNPKQLLVASLLGEEFLVDAVDDPLEERMVQGLGHRLPVHVR